MTQVQCPGLPADWVNGWLAGIGATVLDPRIRLHWTYSGLPVAVLSAQGVDPVECLIESWPDTVLLDDLPLAETWRETTSVRRKVPVEAFRERAQAARGHHHSWVLSSTMTDLCVDKDGFVGHAPFDPAGPGTIKWLHHRLKKVYKHVDQPQHHIRDALSGMPELVEDNGLGFDQCRLGSLSDSTKPLVNPVVEVLAFFGLALLPARGAGDDRRLNRSANTTARQRGWRTHDRRQVFPWPAWGQPLDRNGIDALLDTWEPAKPSVCQMLGVHTAWCSIRYQSRGDSDSTRAFGSKQLWQLNPPS